MILVIPTLTLKNGKSLNVIRGVSGTDRRYTDLSESPLDLCKLIRTENAKSLMLIDKDSFDGENNIININSSCYIAQSLDIPLMIYSNFRSADECRVFLDSGIFRVVVNNLLFTDFPGLEKLINEYTSSKVIFAGEFANRVALYEDYGFTIKDTKFFQRVRDIGGTRVVYIDAGWFKNRKKVSKNVLIELAENYNMKITLYGGVDNPKELWDINELYAKGIDSVMIERPFFENNFPCQGIWRLAEKAEFEKAKNDRIS